MASDDIIGLRRQLAHQQAEVERLGLPRVIRLRLRNGELHPDSEEDARMVAHVKTLMATGRAARTDRLPVRIFSDDDAIGEYEMDQLVQGADGRWELRHGEEGSDGEQGD